MSFLEITGSCDVDSRPSGGVRWKKEADPAARLKASLVGPTVELTADAGNRKTRIAVRGEVVVELLKYLGQTRRARDELDHMLDRAAACEITNAEADGQRWLDMAHGMVQAILMIESGGRYHTRDEITSVLQERLDVSRERVKRARTMRIAHEG